MRTKSKFTATRCRSFRRAGKVTVYRVALGRNRTGFLAGSIILGSGKEAVPGGEAVVEESFAAKILSIASIVKTKPSAAGS